MIRKKISLCAFAKDEEHCIARMLNSVIENVDEVVFVDTGSTDNTIEVVKTTCLDRVPFRIYEVGFTDFGKIRTLTSHLASHEYVLMLDADEEMTDSCRLRGLIVGNHDAIAFPRRRWLDLDKTEQVELDAYPDLQVRFYQNDKNYTWKRGLHEYFDGAHVTHVMDGPIIEHFHDVHKDARRLSERQELYSRLAREANVTIEGGHEV